MSMSMSNRISELWKHAILLLGALIVILPFYVMLSYSLKSPGEIERNEGGFIGAQEMMVDPKMYCSWQARKRLHDAALCIQLFQGFC